MEIEALAGKDEVRNEVTIAPRDFSPMAAAEEDSRKFVRTARRPVRVRPSHVPVCGWRLVTGGGERKRGGNVVPRSGRARSRPLKMWVWGGDQKDARAVGRWRNSCGGVSVDQHMHCAARF